MPPSQIWSSLAFVERVWRTSSLVIVLPVTVLFPIVVTFLFSAVWRHRSALAVYMKCLQVQRQKEVGIVVGTARERERDREVQVCSYNFNCAAFEVVRSLEHAACRL